MQVEGTGGRYMWTKTEVYMIFSFFHDVVRAALEWTSARVERRGLPVVAEAAAAPAMATAVAMLVVLGTVRRAEATANDQLAALGARLGVRLVLRPVVAVVVLRSVALAAEVAVADGAAGPQDALTRLLRGQESRVHVVAVGG